MGLPETDFAWAVRKRRKTYIDPNGCQACDDSSGCKSGVAVRMTATGACVACLKVGRPHEPGMARGRRFGERDLPPDTVASRAQAEDNGWTVFRTGEPCKYGHRGFRFVQGGACTACMRGEGPVLEPGDAALIRQAPDAPMPLEMAVAFGLGVYRSTVACDKCGVAGWRRVRTWGGGGCLTCEGLV